MRPELPIKTKSGRSLLVCLAGVVWAILLLDMVPSAVAGGIETVGALATAALIAVAWLLLAAFVLWRCRSSASEAE